MPHLITHSQYHCTTAHRKESSSHMLSLHRPTSSSSTTNLQWLTSTLLSNSLNCVVATNVFKITPRHGSRTENAWQLFAISQVHLCAGCYLQKTRHVTATRCCGDVIAPARKCVNRAAA
jgi:hypothetical protein